MPTTPPQQPTHTTPANPFGPLIATSFRSNGTMRQYHDCNPTADTPNQNDPFRIDATHATKCRNGQSEGIVEERQETLEEGVAPASGRSRSWDSLAERSASEDVEDTGDNGDDEGSDVGESSSHTVGRSESSSSTLAADEDDGKEISEGEGDSDESMEDDGDEESEASSHTVGRSEDSNSGDHDGDSNEEMDESDDEGDVFGESYREGSMK